MIYIIYNYIMKKRTMIISSLTSFLNNIFETQLVVSMTDTVQKSIGNH